MRKTITRSAAVIVTAAGLSFATLAPATAQSTSFGDSGGSGPLNIHRSKIAHTKKRVIVSTKVTNLKKRNNQGVAFHIQRKPKKKRFGVLISIRKRQQTVVLKKRGSSYTAIKCKKVKTKLNFKRDRARVSIPRKCFGNPRKVRMRVETGKVSGKQHDVTGWSKWVKRG